MRLKRPLAQILFEKGKIDEKQLSYIKVTQEKTGEDTGKIIVKEKLASEQEIAEIISEETGVPFLDLKNFIIDPAAVNVLDEKTVRRLSVIPLYIVKDALTIAMANPQDIIAMDEVKIVSKFKNIQVVMSTKSAIVEGIEQNYALGNTLEDIIKSFEAKGVIYAPSSSVMPHVLASLAAQPPVVKFVNQIIFNALKSRASDIHIEPLQDNVRVRFRVDGVLHTSVTISSELNLPVVPRVKILAGLDIAERRKPQDGRFTVSVAGRQIDLRVATFPMAYGESVSMRLLDKTTALLEIEELGFSPDMREKFQRLVKSPHGIILVTGPTGCGKTTTLYAILNRISSPGKNILTIEDPIEYLIENVSQAQVNPKIGLVFANALRSFLRQDPDTMMIGEIRDYETVEMAFRAALTGHLVFSTLHTNDAPTAITRLKDLGLDKNMLSSSILCVLAQRLVRVICSYCKEQYHPEKTIFDDLRVEFDPEVKFYRGRGCDECNGTGYRGRAGIFELLEFTDEIRILIQKDAPLEEIRKAAINSGMKTLREDGMDKIKQGITTVEEIVRATQD